MGVPRSASLVTALGGAMAESQRGGPPRMFGVRGPKRMGELGTLLEVQDLETHVAEIRGPGERTGGGAPRRPHRSMHLPRDRWHGRSVQRHPRPPAQTSVEIHNNGVHKGQHRRHTNTTRDDLEKGHEKTGDQDKRPGKKGPKKKPLHGRKGNSKQMGEAQ